jgi:hypothetical protein
MGRRVDFWLLSLACAAAFAAAACSSGTHSRDGGSADGPAPDGAPADGPAPDGASPDIPPPGMCGADVPAGQECNALTNLGTTITPVCSTEAAPVGTGGAIADGTYVLTAQTKYDASCTSPLSLSETITIAGDCVQLVFGSILPGTGSSRLTTQGSAISFTRTCEHIDIDGAVTIQPFSMQAYTATSTTFTLFSIRATGGTDVSVFTKL